MSGQFGYALGWVVLAANLMAMLVQTLSAKLGIATGLSLPEICRERLPRPLVVGDPAAGGDLGRVVSGLNGYAGAHAGTVFGVALLVSGVASSCVGTVSGQVVMEGFLRRRVPVFARRAVTMLPAIVVLAAGFSPARALVLSQVFLSFGIPSALIPLVAFTSKPAVMGPLANRRLTTIATVAVTAVIVTLNVYLLAAS